MSYEKNIEMFNQFFDRFGNSPQSLNWGSTYSQSKRFDILLDYIPNKKLKILDVGCGLGHLFEYIKLINRDLTYLGIDINKDFISEAQKVSGKTNFEVIDIHNEVDFGYLKNYNPDFCVASGIFAFYTENSYQFLDQTIKRMYSVAKVGVAFNLLSSLGNVEKGKFFADPCEVILRCKNITPYFSIRHDYMPHDFTVCIYHEGQ